MVRKSSLILALISWMASTGVYALGLGDIHVNSALNQNLDASIDLLSVEKGRLDDIRVTLASPEAFERAGVERPYLLTNLRFKPERLPDGSSVIRVSTQNPVREPFLNFLVEVNWPKGRVVREYTLLLDPPVTLSRAPAPVEAPQVEAPAIVPEEAKPAEAAPTPPVTSQPEAAAPPVSGMAMTEEGRSEYGPVQKGDSLWRIASRNSRSGTDINQMMVAIYRANPDAFFGNNLNNLKSGEILRIPSREEVAEIDRVDASNQYRQHLNVWMAEKEARKPSPAQTAEEETPVSPSAEAPVSETAAAEPKAEPEPEAELKIATARPEGEGAAGASDEGKTEETVARLREELLLAREEAESAAQEGEDLQSRVTDLEGQLELAEKTLALKNEQLAQLQAAAVQATETGEEVAAAEEQPAGEQPVMDQSAAEPSLAEQPAMEQPAAEEPVLDQPIAEQPVEEQPATEEAAAEQPIAEQPVEEQPATEEAAAEQPAMAETTTPPTVTPESKPTPKPVAPKPEPKPEPGLLDTVLGSPLLMALSVGGLLLVVMLVWFLAGRGKSKGDFEESILLGGGDSEVTAEAMGKVGGAGPAQVDETSFLSDFSPSDIDALQDETGEVDPLSEADVYIAYGRYQQAEELIRQAIERDPERYPLYFKLFEILHAVKNAAGYTSFVQEVAGTAVEESDHAAWQKVLAMGAELAPASPLFAGGGAQQGAAERSTDELAALGEDSEVLDLDAITADLDAGGQVGTETAPQDQEEVDLSEFTANMEDTGSLDEIAGSDLDLDLDLDSSLLNLDTDMSAEQGLGLAESEEASADVGEKTIPSVDLLDLAQEEESEEENVVPLVGDEADLEGFSLEDLGGIETDSMFIEAADADEVNTKLDLARAYIDMGDPEGAQDILDEVLTEGDDTQKQEAQRLKEQIS